MSTETSSQTSTQEQDTSALDEYQAAVARLAEERATREWWALLRGTDRRR